MPAPMHMKAAVLRAFDKGLAIEDVAIARPHDRELLARTRAMGVCASDLSTIRGKTRYIASHPRP